MTKTAVDWEYWMDSNDNSRVLKHEFRPVADSLGNRTSLNVHWMYIDGSVFGCTKDTRPCGRQCTNQGRYCAEDPEADLESGSDGYDVVRENVRQYCIFHSVLYKYQFGPLTSLDMCVNRPAASC